MKKYFLFVLVCTCLMLITPFTIVAQENNISSRLKGGQYIEKLVAQIRTRINDKKEKYEKNTISAGFWDMILYLLDFILFKIAQVTVSIILFPLSLIISPMILFVILFIWIISMG